MKNYIIVSNLTIYFSFDGKKKMSYFSSSQFVEHFLSFLTKYEKKKIKQMKSSIKNF